MAKYWSEILEMNEFWITSLNKNCLPIRHKQPNSEIASYLQNLLLLFFEKNVDRSGYLRYCSWYIYDPNKYDDRKNDNDDDDDDFVSRDCNYDVTSDNEMYDRMSPWRHSQNIGWQNRDAKIFRWSIL